MKVLKNNIIIKRILVVLITIIMISNFIMPNYVHAADAGEKLVSGFFYLLAYLGDAGISIMQNVMMGDKEIGDEDSGYSIKYSPGIIFANKVPALDINFINPNTDTINVKENVNRKIGQANSIEDLFNQYSTELINKLVNDDSKDENYEKLKNVKYEEDKKNTIIITYEGKTYNVITWLEITTENKAIYTNNPNAKGVIKIYHYFATIDDGINIIINIKHDGEDETATKDTFKEFLIKQYGSKIANKGQNMDSSISALENLEVGQTIKIGEYDVKIEKTTIDKGQFVYSYAIIEEKNVRTISSSASELQSNISTWYIALRTIALVGLLSVLVYIGIRIILSSASAQDKAKYKNMLKDWVAAICILFILHYAMAFILEITSSLNNIIKSNVITEKLDGTTKDELMSTIRTQAGNVKNAGKALDTAGYVVMYLAMVILTGVFTFQYLKRVIFMAFLTMIAPMIALTYPLDKVKDGKAQAFSFWLREYIFNCLIQPVHLLLYTILISNAIDFAMSNMLYALVALGFLVPAEKFIKEMFGMKSSSPVGNLGAAAGGAMVMSMLNKIKAKPPKEDAGAGASGNPNGVRTATRNGTPGGTATPAPLAPPVAPAQQQTVAPAQQQTVPPAQQQTVAPAQQQTVPLAQQQTVPPAQQQTVAPAQQQTTTTTQSQYKNTGILNGIRGAGQTVLKNQANMLKSTGKWAGKIGKSAPGAILGGTIGLAATVASGGENATAFIGGGMATGGALSNSLIGNAGEGIGESFQKGRLGVEGYSNKQFDKQFYKSDAYKTITQDPSINQTNIKERTQQFLDNGITDATVIRTALQEGLSGDTYKDYKNSGVESAKDIVKLQNANIQATDMKEYAQAGETNANRILKAKGKHPTYSNEQLANMFKLAKHAPKTIEDFKAMMKGRTFNGKTVDDGQAEDIFKELVDFF